MPRCTTLSVSQRVKFRGRMTSYMTTPCSTPLHRTNAHYGCSKKNMNTFMRCTQFHVQNAGVRHAYHEILSIFLPTFSCKKWTCTHIFIGYLQSYACMHANRRDRKRPEIYVWFNCTCNIHGHNCTASTCIMTSTWLSAL
jgi:hypothetical protein